MTMNNYTNSNQKFSVSSFVTKILWRHQQELVIKHPDGVTILINDEDPLDIQANVEGPKDTPYEGGNFRVKIVITSEFPQTAPKGFFMTKIYHPNVSEKGEICVNTLKKDWNSREWSLYHVLEVIKCLLIVPFPESSLNEEAGKLFMEDYEKYFKIASIYTNVHAGVKNNLKAKSNDANVDMSNEEGFVTPVGGEHQLNYNLLRHPKSNSMKSQSSKNSHDTALRNNSDNKNNIGENKNNIFVRNFKNNFSNNNICMKTDTDTENDLKVNQKPSINSLPFILRNNSNSFAFSNSENQCQNVFSTTPTQNQNNNLNQNHNLINPNYTNVMLNNGLFTPSRSKKDEIKKWLSRI